MEHPDPDPDPNFKIESADPDPDTKKWTGSAVLSKIAGTMLQKRGREWIGRKLSNNLTFLSSRVRP